MVLHILTLYFSIAIFVAIYLLSFIKVKGHSPYSKEIVLLIISLVCYIFGYMIELHSKTLPSALFWNQIQYFTLPSLSAIWLIVALRFTGKINKLISKTVFGILLIPLSTFVLRLTNAWHHLYYTFYTFEVYHEISLLGLGRGPWYYVQIIYSLLLMVIVIAVFYEAFINSVSVVRKRYGQLALTTFIALISLILTAINPIILGLDYSAILLPAPIVLISYLIVKEDLFDINTLARNELFNMGENALIVVDLKGRIVDYNGKAIDIFKSYGMTLEMVNLTSYKDNQGQLIDALQSTAKVTIENLNTTDPVYWEVMTNKVTNKHHDVFGYIKTIRDVTEEVNTQRHLEHIAKTDELSQLFNRREFIYQATSVIESINPDKDDLHILMMDIDYFKSVNDTYGHQIGDEVIVGVSQLLKQNFREGDIVARFGGEEFVVLMSGGNSDSAFRRADNFREKVASISLVNNDPDRIVTISIGIGSYEDGITLDELISRADRALYRAKTSGRDMVCW